MQLYKDFIPTNSISYIEDLLKRYQIEIKIKSERRTRHGDFRVLSNGNCLITVNSNLNKYRFLITLIHEIAHLIAFKKYGSMVKPHGNEWKHTFQQLMLPYLRPEIFPNQLLPYLAIHFKNPKASSDTDAKLSLALKHYDAPNDKNYIFEIPLGRDFRLHNGKIFKKGKKLVKRHECLEVATGKIYLFNPNAEVELL